jgi:hypothetical protein
MSNSHKEAQKAQKITDLFELFVLFCGKDVEAKQ